MTTSQRRVRVRVASGNCRIAVSRADGRTRLGSPWTVPMEEGESRWRFSLRWIGETLRLRGNGVILGEFTDLPYLGGQLVMEEACQEGDVRLQPLDSLFFEDDFMREEEALGEWKPLSGSWRLVSTGHPSLSASPFHLCGEAEEGGLIETGHLFWDDYVLQASVRLGDPTGAVGLVFGRREELGQKEDKFYLLRWSGKEAIKDGGTFTLYSVSGERWIPLHRLEKAMPAEQWLGLTVGFRGKRIQCGVNGISCMDVEDPHLIGGKVGLWVEGGPSGFDDVFLRSVPFDQREPFRDLTVRNDPEIPEAFASNPMMQSWTQDGKRWTPPLEGAKILDHTFYRAPIDWFAGAGTWRIARRWTCQPEFSWMRGDPDQGSMAILWHDWVFDGDVCVEAFCANAMTARTLPHYDWGVNRNLSICTDGRDPLSGYAFLWGGPDFPSRLTRRGQVVAETDQLLDPLLREDYQKLAKTLHQSWTGLSLCREGPLITAWMDGKILLQFEDSEPLNTGRAALWSSRFGLLLARVRVAYTTAKRPGLGDLLNWRQQPTIPPAPVVIADSPFDPLKRGSLRFDLLAQDRRKPHLVLETNNGVFAARLPGGPELPSRWIPLSVAVERRDDWETVSLSLADQVVRCMPWGEPWKIHSVRVEDFSSRQALLPCLGAVPGDLRQEVRQVKWGRDKKKALPIDEGLQTPSIQMNPDPRFRCLEEACGIHLFRNFGGLDGALPALCFEEEDERGPFLRAVARRIGGFFGLDAGVPPFDPAKYCWVAFESRSQPHGTMSLVVWGDGYREEAALTGSRYDTPPMGQIEGAARDNKWHECIFHLGSALASASKSKRPPLVKRITFGETGYWSHVKGDQFDLDHFELLSEIQEGKSVEVSPRQGKGVGYEAVLCRKGGTEEKTFRVGEGESFRLKDLKEGAYVLDVRAIGKKGKRGPFARTRLFVTKARDDRACPEIKEFSPSPHFRCGSVEIHWKLEDTGTGVDFSSVELTVGETTYDLASGALDVDEMTGHCTWRPQLGAGPWPEGQVSCRLVYADMAGNQGQTDWKWTFSSLLDDKAPEVRAISVRPEPCLDWHDFERGTHGWESFARFIVDWGDRMGPTGDHALELIQMRKGDRVTAARMGFESFCAREWPFLSMDVCPDRETGFTVLARMRNADIEVKGQALLRPGVWQHVFVDLEGGLATSSRASRSLPVEFLLLKFDEMCVVGLDNCCLRKRTAERVHVHWKVPEDASGVDVYRVALTELPVSSEEGWTEIRDNELDIELEAVRSVYLHVMARDRAGNLSEPKPFLLQKGRRISD